MSLEFYLLGKPAIRLAGAQEKTPTNTRKTALLFYLAHEPGLHRREALAQRFWCDASNKTARAGLRAAIHALEQEFAPHLAVIEDLIGFPKDADVWVDAQAFRRGLALAEGVDDPTAILTRTLALYRGDFLAGFWIRGGDPNEEWQRMQAASLHQLAVDGYVRLLRLHLTQGRITEGIAAANRLALLDPYNDEGHLLHMRLLLRGGQTRAAERLYEAYTVTRKTDLGESDPDPGMKALYDTLRHQHGRAPAPRASRTPAVAAERPHRTPAPPHLIGRETELNQITQLLLHPANRLVTLVGLGGVGKTWLALHAAHRLEASFAHGAAFVALPTSNSAATEVVTSVIANALDLTFAGSATPAQQIAAYLGGREILLVLDNFEQLLPAGELVEQLLAAAPRLKILVTSQIPLNLRSETRYPVGGLFLPPLWNADEASIAHSDAVRLFVFRAHRLHPGIVSSSKSLAEVAAICEAAGGLPLAIEQAASWLGHLNLAEIRIILSQRPAKLPPLRQDLPARQQSVDAAFEYSWRLLTDEQQCLLAQASVFPSPFDRVALQAVTGASLKTIAELADRSLISVLDQGQYAMHSLWRQLAAEKLRTAFEPELAEEATRRHAEYYLRLVASLGERVLMNDSAEVRRILRDCAFSIEQAAAWAITRGPVELILPAATVLQEFLLLEAQNEAGVTVLTRMLAAWSGRDDLSAQEAALVEAVLAGGLARFLTLCARSQEAAQHIAHVARWSETAEPSTAAFRAICNLAWASFDMPGAEVTTFLDRLRGMADALEDTRGFAESRLVSALWETRQGNLASASALLLRSLQDFEALGWSVRAADCHTRLGQLYAARLAQPKSARAHLEQALDLCARLRLPYREIVAHQTLGIVAYSEGDYAGARDQLAAVIPRFQELHLQIQTVRARIQLGVATTDLGVCQDAALHATSLALGLEAAEAATRLGNTQLAAYAHYVIGATYHSLGLVARARDAFEAGIALARQVDAGEVLEILIGPSIMVLLDMGDLSAAARAGAELIDQMNTSIEEPRFGHAYCGYLFMAQDDLESAARCFAATPGMDAPDPRTQPWFAHAALAEVRLRQGESRAALALVEGMLKHRQRPLHATLYPARTCLSCYRVLLAQNDPRAAVVLAAAQRWLYSSVERLTDPSWRTPFVEGIPARRELLALRSAWPHDLHFALPHAFPF